MTHLDRITALARELAYVSLAGPAGVAQPPNVHRKGMRREVPRLIHSEARTTKAGA